MLAGVALAMANSGNQGKRKAGRRGNGKGKAKAKSLQPPSNNRVIIDQLVTEEAQQHGDYAIETLSVTEGDFGPDEKGERSVVKNRSVDVIAVWASSGALDDRQLGAVAIYRHLHSLVFGSPPRVAADWSAFLVSRARSVGGYESMALDRIEAMEDLDRISERYFRKLPTYVESTWLNAVVHNLAAGPAGHLLNHDSDRAARAGTLTVVRLVCDLLATEFRL